MDAHEIEKETNIALFSDVRYFLINTKCSGVEDLLRLYGAQEERYLSSFITHVICDDADNPDYSEAKEVFELVVVKSDWVSKCIFVNKLLPEEAFSPDLCLVFNNVAMGNVNLGEEVAGPVRALIEYYGGEVKSVLEDCTHVLAIEYNTEALKVDEAVIDDDKSTNEYGDKKVKKKSRFVVTPDWVVDSVKENRLVDEAVYHPKYLINDPKNTELIAELERKEKEEKERLEKEAEETKLNKEAMEIEYKTIDSVRKIDRIELRKSIDIIHHVIKLQNSPKPQQQPQQQFKSLVDKSKTKDSYSMDNMDEFKKLSASSIQSQLENTIRFNQQASKHITVQQPITVLTEAIPATPVSPANQEGQTNTTHISPTKNKTVLKRSRESSSGISPNGNSTGGEAINLSSQQQQQQTSDSFTIDMDDIFATVLSNANKEGPVPEDLKAKTEDIVNLNNVDKELRNQMQQNNGVLPIYLNLMRPLETSYKSLIVPIPSFEDYLAPTETQLIQENSNLIQFDRCLLGCVFYLKTSSKLYTPDCLSDWQGVIEKYGGKVVDEYDLYREDITHVLTPNRFTDVYKKAIVDKKRTVTAYWLEDVLQEQKLRQPWLAYHFPCPFEMNNGPLTNHIISTHGFQGREKLMIKTIIWLLNGKYASYLMNMCSFLVSKNCDGLKIDKAKKWNINVVNGVWLMELYLGNVLALNKDINSRYTELNVNHFGYDHSFVSDYLEQWKALIKLPLERIKEANSQTSSPLRPLNRSPQKRRIRSPSLSPADKMFKKDLLLETGLSWQRPQSAIPIVMFTGFTTTDVQQYSRDVSSLNGVIASHCAKVTHLVVNKIERTARLLKCISTCEFIVSIQWLLDSKAEGHFKDPKFYEIKDDSFESHYMCNLKESLERAKSECSILSGLQFYLSPSVRPSYNDLEEMIKNAGGIVVRDVFTLNLYTEPYLDEKKTGLTSKYVVVGSQKDLCILKPFIDKKIPIYHEELVLSGLLCQKIDAKMYIFHVD